ncbi:MAG TPA: PIN domain-containing protein [Bryobacteraceae bacterium]|nr:PIN domain-containing protein [Bryobacteraceae bacterium]
MSGLAFFDANVLLHTDNLSAPGKKARATALFADHLRTGRAVISLQVLQEYFSVATRKLGMSAADAQRKVEIMAQAHVVCFEACDVIAAIELHRLSGISFWDALIVHAARSAGAGVLYSEDLASGGVIGSVRIKDPFTT